MSEPFGSESAPQVALLTGGGGGARLAEGLQQVVGGHNLSAIVNTGDDFRPYGLYVSPDSDSVLYTLSGRLNQSTGWGRQMDTAHVMEELARLGDEAWFHLGDSDLALHLVRTGLLGDGVRLTEIAAHLCRAFGVSAAILPGTDQPLRTVICTASGEVGFQEWFVRDRCEPPAIGVLYEGADAAKATPETLAALAGSDITVIGPSNPFLSIGPLLSIAGLAQALAQARAPVVAVSPVVGGTAFKGPTARMLQVIDGEATPRAVARRYGDLLDGFVLDESDVAQAADIRDLGLAVHVTRVAMDGAEGRRRLAEEVAAFGASLARPASGR